MAARNSYDANQLRSTSAYGAGSSNYSTGSGGAGGGGGVGGAVSPRTSNVGAVGGAGGGVGGAVSPRTSSSGAGGAVSPRPASGGYAAAAGPVAQYSAQNANPYSSPYVGVTGPGSGAAGATLPVWLTGVHKGALLFEDKYAGRWNTTAVTLQLVPPNKQGFAYEAALLQSLRHPHVVNFLGLWIDDARNRFIVSEAIGDTLDVILRGRGASMSAAVKLTMAQQCAAGIAYLSNRGVVHRDVRAHSVFMCADRTVKVGEFSMSRSTTVGSTAAVAARDPNAAYQPFSAVLNSAVGGVLESDSQWPWDAPEVAKDRIFSQASDVWAFGVLLWEIWSNGDQPKTMTKKSKRLPKPPQCPDAVYDLMLKCWDAKPSRRPLFADIVKALLALSAAT